MGGGVERSLRAVSSLSGTHGLVTRPGTRIHASSEGLGWRSVFVSAQREAPFEHECEPVGDHLVVIHLSGPVEVERRIDGDRDRRVVPPGGSFMVPGGVGFGVRLAKPLDSIHFYLRAALVERVADEFGVSAKTLAPRFGEADPLLEQVAVAMRGALLAPTDMATLYIDHLARAAATRIVYAQIGSEARALREPRATPIDDRAIGRAIAHMRDKLDRDVSLDELAAIANLSTGHFARQFKRATGMPPHQYLMDLRIEQAKRLLGGTDAPIASIALDCGFCNQEHLGRVFRRRMNATPAAYRAGVKG